MPGNSGGARKKRFGVSMNPRLAESLDMLAETLGVERSRLVEEAVRQYLEDHMHMLIPHECHGVIVALCPDNIGVAESVRNHRENILGHMHLHLGGYCLDIIVVEGPSGSIASLYGELERKNCKLRFLPIGGETPY